MMDKDKLRKADLFSGGVILLTGLFIVTQALKMPMKDSWGGVQNVWYVSPAIFPLFVGAMIMLLGALLMRTALRAVGRQAAGEVMGFIMSRDMTAFLKQAANVRFYAILTLFVSLVFITIPRIDFFVATVFFLTAFIPMFYLDDDALLKRLLICYLGLTALVTLVLALGLNRGIGGYAGDILVLACAVAFSVYARQQVRRDPVRLKKFRTGLVLAVAAPLLIGTVFKYLLLVPMPFEGMVVALLDAVWYFEF